MAMTSGTNKWASRAVVILQLAAWSAVGMVLLQKGVSSLQKESVPRNITQIIPISSPSFHPAEDKHLSVIPIIDGNPKLTDNSKLQNSLSSGKVHLVEINRVPSDFIKPKKHSLESPEFNEEIDGPKLLESVDTLAKTDLEKLKELEEYPKTANHKNVDSYLKNIEVLVPNNKSSMKLIDGSNPNLKDPESQRVHETEEMLEPQIDIFQSESHPNENKTSPSSTPKPNIWESRRRLRLSHLSGGGAAAAVAMVAVGAVMLVLGPAVIVLRALDERRQERRFLKLSARDDLPPTYEQATLMDEAPRYSSLSLNTILGPPPPPSPTPARVHLV